MDELNRIKADLLTACRILDQQGIMDELGHFSARLPEKDRVLINGKVSPGQAREEDLVIVDLEGNVIEGTLEPASETPMHLSVFKKRPDVMAVAHTHSPFIILLGTLGIGLRALDNLGASIVTDETPIFDEYGLIDSFAAADRAADVLGGRTVVMLKGHGSLVVGRTIAEACISNIWAEKAARLQYQALLAREPDWYPAADMAKMSRQMAEGKGYLRSWNYYRWKLSGKV
jgi:ribulose-5-phosphate 4-epimerase/fuculose-1-phosphate aldolase